ncbi:LAME_0D08658g1_1 [Lachancea meyersii CBS 8951]|uniref:LAME_0D08658g1_1 n=1 Tax=Lachancea meyersii CBS 8951 TaxID=1266667 RepID=A0A1G4JB91_9SACH|nr:LAME_0D08658g1_1 [Lachancea meyersii CBS 8951]
MNDPYNNSVDDGCDAFRGNRAPPPIMAGPGSPMPPYSLPLLAQQSQHSTPTPSQQQQQQQQQHQQLSVVTSPTSDTGSSSSQKPSRRLWTPMEDLVLLTLVLTHKHALPVASNARRFWEFVSQQLLQEHSLHRNTRQCRDRFNLLHARGVRNATCNVEPSSHRDALTLKIAQVFDSTDRGHYRLSREYIEQLNSNSPQTLSYDGSDQQFHAESQLSHVNAYPTVTGPGASVPMAIPHAMPHENDKHSAPTSELIHISNSITSLVSSSQRLATDFQDLSERFAHLTNQVRYIQMRLDKYQGTYQNDVPVREPSHEQFIPGGDFIGPAKRQDQ